MRIKQVFDLHMSTLHCSVPSRNQFWRSNTNINEKCDILCSRIAEVLKKKFFLKLKSYSGKPRIVLKLKLLIKKHFPAYHSKNLLVLLHLKSEIKEEITKVKCTWLEKSASNSSGFNSRFNSAVRFATSLSLCNADERINN